MSFLMHVVAYVSHYVVFDTTLSYLCILYSQLEFQNLDFFIPCRSLYRKLWLKVSNSKILIIRPRYELFNACGGSCPSLACLWHYVTFSFTPLSSSFRIWNFSSHVVAYIASFDSSSWTRKSDIIRPRYEVFNACGGSSLSLCSLLHNITLPFHSLLLARVSEYGFFHPMS